MDFDRLRLEIGRLADEVERLADQVEQLARQHGNMESVARRHNSWTEQHWQDVDPTTGEVVPGIQRPTRDPRRTERPRRNLDD